MARDTRILVGVTPNVLMVLVAASLLSGATFGYGLAVGLWLPRPLTFSVTAPLIALSAMASLFTGIGFRLLERRG